jgi:hypothetical protein
MWKNHVEQMIPMLHAACYAIRSMDHISSINILKSIFYAYFHSVIRYGKIYGVTLPIVWRFSFYNRKSSEFWQMHNPKLQVEAYLNTSPFPCQYIHSLINFIIINQKHFQTNSSIHNIKTRNKHHLHRPNTNLSCFQKSIFYAGNNISTYVHSVWQFLKKEKAKSKADLRKYLKTH